jgi:hypothetical protein
MKKYIVGAAAAMAMVAPGVASADSGEIGVTLGSLDFGSGDYDTYGVNGAYSTNLTGDWVVQFDAASERLDVGYGSYGTGYASGSLGVRNESYAVYGFLGMGNLYYYSSTNLGVGGQLFFDNATVNASVGYMDIDAGGDFNITDVGVDGTWFFTDNLGVTGAVGWAEVDSGGSYDWTRYGVSGVWRPEGTAFSIGGGYENIDFDGGDADYWTLSLTYNFGTGTEKERSQSGASFNGAERLFREATIGIF